MGLSDGSHSYCKPCFVEVKDERVDMNCKLDIDVDSVDEEEERVTNVILE